MTHLTALITRPLPQALETAEKLKKLHISSCIAPLLRIEFTNVRPQLQIALEENRTGLITSIHGLEAMEHNKISKEIPLLITGMHTTEEARKKGFINSTQSGNTIEETLSYIQQQYHPGTHKFVYVSGLHISRNLTQELCNYDIKHIIAYEALETDISACTEPLQHKKIDIMLFFSRRTAEIFAAQAKQHGLLPYLKNIHAFTLSKAIATAIQDLCFKEIHIPLIPDSNSLLELIASVRISLQK